MLNYSNASNFSSFRLARDEGRVGSELNLKRPGIFFASPPFIRFLSVAVSSNRRSRSEYRPEPSRLAAGNTSQGAVVPAIPSKLFRLLQGCLRPLKTFCSLLVSFRLRLRFIDLCNRFLKQIVQMHRHTGNFWKFWL